jgi:hypothetical protein
LKLDESKEKASMTTSEFCLHEISQNPLFLFPWLAYAVGYLIFRFCSEPINHWIPSAPDAICISRAATGRDSLRTWPESKAQSGEAAPQPARYKDLKVALGSADWSAT